MFEFYETGELKDDDLELVLIEKFPGDPGIGFVPAYKFEMRRVGTNQTVGEIHLRIGDTHALKMYGGHIGYKVAREYRGHKYASRSIKLLLSLAQSHGLNPIWITCDPANLASRRTCELAGAQLVEIVDLPAETDLYQRGFRRGCRYRLDLSMIMQPHFIQLRPATEADSEFYYDVKKQALGHYVAQVWGWDEAFQREFHRADFGLRRPDVVVYRDLDIGTIEIISHADHIHLGEFYLLPQFQRQGIGTVLLERVLAEAREKEWPVRLEVLKINPVRSLYQRHGFVVTGEREHHFLMERAVA